jgi:hypothetical protein
MVKNCTSQEDLVYLAALVRLCGFVLNGRMCVTGELHRKWSWANLKQCPRSCLEWLRKASDISSHDSRLIWKVKFSTVKFIFSLWFFMLWSVITKEIERLYDQLWDTGVLCPQLNQLKHECDHWPPYLLELVSKCLYRMVLSHFDFGAVWFISRVTFFHAITVHNTSHMFTIHTVLLLIPFDVRSSLN